MSKKITLWDTLWLTGIIGLFFIFMLGSRALNVPDEGRYAEIPREMILLGDFITPHLNFIKYFEKPPLLYWVNALSLQAFGYSEWAVRLPTALCAILGCLLTYWTSNALYGRRAGILASLILATSSLYFIMAHLTTPDMVLTLCLSTSLLCFIVGVQTPVGPKKRWILWGMYVGSALAMLSKGLVGLLFPGLIIFLWLLVFNQWSQIKQLYIPSGLIIFLAIILPWHIAVQYQNPEFFNFYFIEQHILRYATLNAGRSKPWWFFSAVLLVGFFPWIVFLISSIRHSLPLTWQQRHTEKNAIFFMLWAGIIFLFFNFSHSQLVPYLLPIMPPLAILTARYCATQVKNKTIQFILLGMMALSWIGITQIERIDDRTIKPLAQTLNTVLQPNDIVASYQEYYQDLPFYTRHRVMIVDWLGELRYGSQHQDMGSWMPDQKYFWQLWQNPQRIYLVMTKRAFMQSVQKLPYKIRVIAQTRENILLTNF